MTDIDTTQEQQFGEEELAAALEAEASSGASDEELDDDVELSEEGADGGRTSGNRAARARLTRQVTKRVIQRYLELEDTPAEQVRVLAVAIGAPDDVVEVAAAITASGRVSVHSLEQIVAIHAEESPFTAMVTVMQLDKAELKRVWSVLEALGSAKGALPAKETVAAGKVTEAIKGLSKDRLATIESAIAIVRK